MNRMSAGCRAAALVAGVSVTLVLGACDHGGGQQSATSPQAPAAETVADLASSPALSAPAAPTPTPTMQAPVSALCDVLDLTSARAIAVTLTGPAPYTMRQGDAPPQVCTYVDPMGTTLSLSTTARPYATERSAADTLAGNPTDDGMTAASVRDVPGLADEAFAIRADLASGGTALDFLVWRSAQTSYVLTYARATRRDDDAEALLGLAAGLVDRLG